MESASFDVSVSFVPRVVLMFFFVVDVIGVTTVMYVGHDVGESWCRKAR